MNGGLNWIKKYIGNELTHFLNGTIFSSNHPSKVHVCTPRYALNRWNMCTCVIMAVLLATLPGSIKEKDTAAVSIACSAYSKLGQPSARP